MVPNKTVRYFILSQLSLLVFLGICNIIRPTFLVGNFEGGFSNYGTRAATVIPFSLAYLFSGLFTLLAIQSMDRSSATIRRIGRALYIQVFLLLVVLLSTYPYKLNPFFKYVHIGVGLVLLAYNFWLIIWVTEKFYQDKINKLLLLGGLGGVIFTLVSLSGAFHLLLLAQLLSSLVFGIFIIRLGAQLSEKS